MNLPFKHSSEVTRFWRRLAQPLLGQHPTPFYLFSVEPIAAALRQLDQHFSHLPVRHWLSCKTQPLRPLLQWWQQQGRPIEVVSEFEFLAARAEGYAPNRILLNGPAKHAWLPRYPVPGLFVNFDSPAEAEALAPLAKKLRWRCGLRVQTEEEFDPEAPNRPTQFGLARDELVETLRKLQGKQVQLETLHFHLRTNVASAAIYARALGDAAAICRRAGFAPRFVDCGGGFPPPHVVTRGGKPLDARFSLSQMAQVLGQALKQFPSADELWLENGRWLSARSGVLVVKVLDVKERRGRRYLICDGGRTTQALISTWEAHQLLSLPERRGPSFPTTVTGPTCMAFDQLASRSLPRSVRPGDHLLWLDAGAYHLPWETRFSHGLAAVFWHDGRKTRLVRQRESFTTWWEQWRTASLLAQKDRGRSPPAAAPTGRGAVIRLGR